MEVEAVQQKEKNVYSIDLQRLKVSKNLFQKIQKKNDRFFAMYGGDGCHLCTENPVKRETVVETMRQRKLELECQQKKKCELFIFLGDFSFSLLYL